MTQMPPIVERMLALALLLGLVLLVAVFGVLPFVEKARVTSDALEFNREMIAKLSRSAAHPGSYDAQIDVLLARINDSGLYIRAETEPLAAAAVQEQLKRAGGLSGGAVRSVHSLPRRADGAEPRVAASGGVAGNRRGKVGTHPWDRRPGLSPAAGPRLSGPVLDRAGGEISIQVFFYP